MKLVEQRLFENSTTATFSLEILRHARVGVDMGHYIGRLLHYRKENLLDAVGGFPSSILQSIQSDLDLFAEFEITPVFVFQGLDLVEQHAAGRAAALLNASQRVRNKAWAKHEQYMAHKAGHVPPLIPHEPFKDNSLSFSISQIQSDLIAFFQARGVSYMVAPYASWIQLAHLHETREVDIVYGPVDLLLLPSVDKFVFGIEYPLKEFRSIDKKHVLNDLRVSQQQLVDICVALGYDLQPTQLPIFKPDYSNGLNTLDLALSLIYSGGSIYSLVLQSNNDQIITKFQKGVLALQYTPVLQKNGCVDILSSNKSDLPEDIHEIIGERLPHEYYFYLSIGLINSKILNSLIYGDYVETQPIDGGSNKQYQELVNKVPDSFKNKEINLLTANCARYFQFKKIKYTKWFDSSSPVLLENKMFPTIQQSFNSLVVKLDGDNNSESFDFNMFFTSFKQDKLELVRNQQLVSNNEVISNSLFRTLLLLDFFKIDSDGKIIPTDATSLLSSVSNEFYQESIPLMILLKLQFPLTLEFTESGKPVAHYQNTTIPPHQRSIITFMSRLASMISVDQNHTFYTGPISKGLLAYRSCHDLIRKSTRELFECVLVNSLVMNETNKITKENEDWRKFVNELPWKKITPNTILGIVFECFLENYFNPENNLNLIKTEKFIFEFFNNNSTSIIDIKKDFKTALRFIKNTETLFMAAKKINLVDDEFINILNDSIKLTDEILNLL